MLPPLSRSFKVNVDEKISQDKQSIRLWVVIIDEHGDFVTDAVQKALFDGNIAYAELKAAK